MSDLYLLNENFQREDVIDDFETFIWTDRYASAGDTKIELPLTRAQKARVPVGSFLGTSDSEEVMFVESHNEKEGKLQLIGPSILDILRQRICRDTWVNNRGYFALGPASPGYIAMQIVQEMCMDAGTQMKTYVLRSGQGVKEVVPNLVNGGYDDSLPEISWAAEYGNVYDAVKKICDAYGLGFKLTCTNVYEGNYTLSFEVYKGRDLSSLQDNWPAVIFDSAMDTLTDLSELESVAGYKNVAYAWATNIVAQNFFVGEAFVDGGDALRGFKRRTLYVDCSDIQVDDFPDDGVTLKNMLNQRAVDALANNNYVRLADGQLVPQNNFVYGEDYFLGDIVELRGNNVLQKARIVEWTRTKDATGEKAYPTLSVLGAQE